MPDRRLSSMLYGVLGRIIARVTGTGFLTLTAALTADRSKTFQNTTGTIAELESAQTFTVAQTISDTTSAATSLTGALKIGNGVAATNVGIGGGNINLGGTLTVGSLTSGRIPFSGTAGLQGDAAWLRVETAAIPQGLTVGDGTGNCGITINGVGATNANRDLTWASNTGTATTGWRWTARISTAEGGSNSGSDWALIARSDAGSIIDTPFSIQRAANGLIYIARGITSSVTTSASTSLTGALVIGNGVAATSVGIGGGNINAGGTGTFGGAINVTAVSASVISNNSSGQPVGLVFRNTVAASVDGGTALIWQGDTTVTTMAAIRSLWVSSVIASGAYTRFDVNIAGTLTEAMRLTATGTLTTNFARILRTRSVVSAAATTVLDGTDHAVFLTGATTQTFTLPAAAAGRQLIIKNRSTGALTVNRAGADTIDGLTTLNVAAGAGIILVANGTDWCVI